MVKGESRSSHACGVALNSVRGGELIVLVGECRFCWDAEYMRIWGMIGLLPVMSAGMATEFPKSDHCYVVG